MRSFIATPESIKHALLISVCIPTVRATTVKDAIASICHQKVARPNTAWELLILCQGADAALHEIAMQAEKKDAQGRVRYLALETRGVSAARNAGLAAAASDIVAFVDDDCEARHDFVDTLCRYFDKDPEAGLVGGSLIAPVSCAETGFGGLRRLSACPSLLPTEALYAPKSNGANPGAPEGWDWIGAGFAVRRSIVERVGYFDTFLGPGATFPCSEDTDFKLRLESAGIPQWSTPHAVVYHTHGTRYGLKETTKHVRNYSMGAGALAAKMTLAKDERGVQWRRQTRRLEMFSRPRECLTYCYRVLHFERAYKRCLSEFQIDASGRFLEPRHDAKTLNAS